MLQTYKRRHFTEWYRQALRFMMPVECIGCNRILGSDPIPFVCRLCWENIQPLTGPSCACCDQPFVSSSATLWTPDHKCQDCLERPPVYQRAWTLFPYVPPLQNAICSFKYRGKLGMAKPLASLMILAMPPSLKADIVVPVPLHPSRLRAREFNQSLLLADYIGRHMGLPVSATALIRVVSTDPQTTLTRHERLRNLRRAFAVRTPLAVTGRRILLVDDVFTTGTTLNECAKTLLKAGAESITAITLARTIDSSLIPDRILAKYPVTPNSPLGL